MINIDLDDEFLDLFYDITNSKRPDNPNIFDMKKQLINIVDTLKEVNKNSKKPFMSKAFGDNEEQDDSQQGPAILIVDDLGVITYQLKVLMSQFELDIDCSQEIYDAVNKFKQKKYKYVIMDLFIPTEREGFILLTELKKMASAANVQTIIGVITASPRKEIEQQCMAKGADFFVEKNNDWQNQLRKIMDSYINCDSDNEG